MKQNDISIIILLFQTPKKLIKNLKIYEVGVKYYGRKYEDGKKITRKDGFSALRCIFYYNFFC